MPARVRSHLHRLRDYSACVSSVLPASPVRTSACVCVCVRLLSCCPSHLCVNVGRGDQYERKKAARRREKVSLVRCRIESHCVQETGRLVHCVCVCARVVARHRRPKGIGCSGEKKRRETETDMQSKAREGVPVAHARSLVLRVLDISLFLSSFAGGGGGGGRVFPSLARSFVRSFGSC